MKHPTFSAIGGATLITLVVTQTAMAEPARMNGLWLEQPLTNWNKPGAAVPKAPSPQSDPPMVSRCQAALRVPETAEDKAVVAAGWSLYGSYQRFSGASLVTGMSGVDGMCRPLGYQAFVFVNGKFAGTLSPAPMDSRSDGALNEVYLYGPANLTATFARYGDQDALCCPSRTSTISYQIDRQGSQVVVVPTSATTAVNNRSQ